MVGIAIAATFIVVSAWTVTEVGGLCLRRFSPNRACFYVRFVEPEAR